MIKLTLAQAATIIDAQLIGAKDIVFHGISHDSRMIQPNELFIAIIGEQFDGHQFITAAEQKNAAAVLVSKEVQTKIPQLIVKDTIKALGQLANYWREQFDLTLIGVTGSNGKTTVKNMLTTILIEHCQNSDAVLSTIGNLNNHIGLPLTICQLNSNHQFAVIEMGMNHFAEIDYLTKISKPTIAIITNAAESHLAGVGGTVAGVAKAKGEIFNGLNKNGIAILNRDDNFYDYWLKIINPKKHITFGQNNTADFFIEESNDNLTILHALNNKIAIKLNLPGSHNLLNAATAAAATFAAGISLATIKDGLAKVESAKGRMQHFPLKNGINLIDDTYNANPFSLDAAVATLKKYPTKKILILGDMKELGDNEIELHAKSGEKIRAAGIDQLFTFGNLSAATSKTFGENAFHFNEQQKLIAALIPNIQQNTTILVKGSRSMKMENIIQALLKHVHEITYTFRRDSV